jgi:cytochrome c peroxidase
MRRTTLVPRAKSNGLLVSVTGAVFVLLAAGCGDGEPPDHAHGDHDHDTDHDTEHDHGDAGAHPPEPSLDGSAEAPDGSILGDFEWRLPISFPRPVVPADNPMSDAKVELGRHLFYDKRLSENATFACATCHQQERAFADERAVGLGSTGELHTRGSMSLTNVAYSPTLTWANPLLFDLERQAQVPIFGDDPIELGMTSVPEVEMRFRAIPRYRELFAAAFPDEDEPITMLNLQRAIAAFQRTLISGDSPFDRFTDHGETDALSDSAKRGMVFVTTNEDHRFECNHCHGGFNFTDHVTWEGLDLTGSSPLYHQTGLYDIDGKGGYPEPNTGVYSTSLVPEDMGKFKAPTLRNIALTAPYMHDGSIATLSEVLDHYGQGGRSHHDGRTDALLKPFEITDQERADIIAFLESLTDESFVTDPRFADPWPSEPQD